MSGDATERIDWTRHVDRLVTRLLDGDMKGAREAVQQVIADGAPPAAPTSS